MPVTMDDADKARICGVTLDQYRQGTATES